MDRGCGCLWSEPYHGIIEGTGGIYSSVSQVLVSRRGLDSHHFLWISLIARPLTWEAFLSFFTYALLSSVDIFSFFAYIWLSSGDGFSLFTCAFTSSLDKYSFFSYACLSSVDTSWSKGVPLVELSNGLFFSHLPTLRWAQQTNLRSVSRPTYSWAKKPSSRSLPTLRWAQ